MNSNIAQRIENVKRVATAQHWDLATQSNTTDGVLLKFTPAGQLKDPAVLPAAITQLGYALAPFLARMTEYISPQSGGPSLTFLVPRSIEIVKPQP
jgi:hypothetical protein